MPVSEIRSTVQMCQMIMNFRKFIRSEIFVIIFIYIGIAVFVVPYAGQKLPYSTFYRYSSTSNKILYQRLLNVNSERIQEANRIMDSLECSLDCLQSKNLNTKSPEFCFVIVSVSRPVVLHYLTQVVASLVPQITADVDCVFTVYNGEGPSHKEALNLSTVIPVFSRGKISVRKNRIIKEKEDYVQALDWCQRKRATFTVVLEDDALPPADFVDHLRFVLDYRMSKKSKKWAFLKLFYPEKWLGWANEWTIILELALSSLLVGLFLTILTYVIQFLIMHSICHLDSSTTLFRLGVSCVLAIYILISLGRPHWIALRRISHHLSSVVPAPECCTPGVVYPQAHLHDIRYLRGVNVSVEVDLLLDKFAKKNGLDKLLVVPNMVKHIGFVSALGKGWKNPIEFI